MVAFSDKTRFLCLHNPNDDPNLYRVHALLEQSINLLDEAAKLTGALDLESKNDAVKNIASAIGCTFYARTFIPGAPSDDSESEDPEPDGPLTDEQQARVDQLTYDQLAAIDEALLAHSSHQWRKVARVVGGAMMNDADRVEGIPDIFYAQRVRKLVEEGRLESEGNLDYMRFSEVRLPAHESPADGP